MCPVNEIVIPALQALGKPYTVVDGEIRLVSGHPPYRVSIRELSGVPGLRVTFRPFVTTTEETRLRVYETALLLGWLRDSITCGLNAETREIEVMAELPLFEQPITTEAFTAYFQCVTQLFLLCLSSLNRARWGRVPPEAAVWSLKLSHELEDILEHLKWSEA